MKYTIPEPKQSIAAYILSAVVVIGLVALFIAAFVAFSAVMPPIQAFFAALLIESGAVVESLAFAKDKNGIAFAGLLFSLTVSATYNYIQVQQAGAGTIENGWQLLTLAAGPLASLTFLSLALGKEFQQYEKAKNKWAEDRQEWYETEQLRQEQKQKELRAEQEAERLRLERQRARETRKKEAAELRLVMARNNGNAGVSNIDDWRKVPEDMLPQIAAMSPQDVEVAFPLIAPRTARDWPRKAREKLELSAPENQSNGHTETIGGK
jgi:hypothetical protein